MDDCQLINNLHRQALAMGVCGLFTGKEKTLEELAALFATPQGMEFCMAHRWPSMNVLRGLDSDRLRASGIYLNCGSVSLKNPRCAVLIGRTHANIICDDTAAHNIYLMHGASAMLTAAGWAVARAELMSGCNIIKRVLGNAVIL